MGQDRSGQSQINISEAGAAHGDPLIHCIQLALSIVRSRLALGNQEKLSMRL